MTAIAGADHDYAHVFHAGNVGDVLKHVILAAVLEEAGKSGPVTYIDTHSGEGLHQLRTTGEWTEGVYRIWKSPPIAGPGMAPWLSIVRGLSTRSDRPERYPGSPWIAARLLGNDARLECFELAPEPYDGLSRHFANDARVTTHAADGFAGLSVAISRAANRKLVVLCDPPYVAKDDWTRASNAVIETLKARPDAIVMLWYPIKSWSRPHVLHRALREAGVAGTTIDLITMPLDQKRNRLNGSGLFVANVPDQLIDTLAGPLHAIGRLCAIQHARWSLHVEAWKAPVGG